MDDARMTREEIRRDNARRLLSPEKGAKAEMARLIDMEPSQLTQIIGKNFSKNIGNSIARRIELAYGKPEGWLDEPHEDKATVGEAMDVDAFYAGNPNVVPIPKVQIRAVGGVPGFVIDASEEDDLQIYPLERSWLERNGFSSNRLVAMRVKGDSMKPIYSPGDVIVVNTADKTPSHGKEFVVNFDGDIVLKTLSQDGGWWLTSFNSDPKYHRRSVRSGETSIVGRVVKHDRNSL